LAAFLSFLRISSIYFSSNSFSSFALKPSAPPSSSI